MSRQNQATAAAMLPWRMGLMLWQAQAVIAMRMLGAAGLWSLSPGESNRMVTEKVVAAAESGRAAARAMARCASPALVAGAALKPVGQRTNANMRRLLRRGSNFISD